MKLPTAIVFCIIVALIPLGCGGGKVDPITNSDPEAIRRSRRL